MSITLRSPELAIRGSSRAMHAVQHVVEDVEGWRRPALAALVVDRSVVVPYLVTMFLDQLRERLSDPARFKPFLIRTSDGREFAIRRPFTVVVAARAIAILHRGKAVEVNAPDIVAIDDVADARQRRRSRRQRSRRS
jgi:hypothetical protein